MVPYVRKSFYKHYVDGMRFCSFGYEVPENHKLNKFKKLCNNDMSIDDEYYKEFISQNEKSMLTFLLYAIYYLRKNKNNYNYNDLLRDEPMDEMHKGNDFLERED